MKILYRRANPSTQPTQLGLSVTSARESNNVVVLKFEDESRRNKFKDEAEMLKLDTIIPAKISPYIKLFDAEEDEKEDIYDTLELLSGTAPLDTRF